MNRIASVIATALVMSASVATAEDISIKINGREYVCTGTACDYKCEAHFNGYCGLDFVQTSGVAGMYALTDGQGKCWKLIKEGSDFDGLVACNKARHMICDLLP